jgi:hypothetical protein
MLKSQLIDGTGSGRHAEVTENFALKVQTISETSRGTSPADIANLRLLREYLKDSSGAFEMNVNGSVTPVEYKISSVPSRTQWIVGMRFLLEDASMELNTADFRRFGTATGAGTPLTNGVQIETFQSGETISVANEPIRTLGDFLRYADSFTNLVNAVGTQDDYVSFDFDLDKPVVLASGGGDSIIVRIRDNLTTVNSFRCIVRGYQESVA